MLWVGVFGGLAATSLIIGLYQFSYHRQRRSWWLTALIAALALFVAGYEAYLKLYNLTG